MQKRQAGLSFSQVQYVMRLLAKWRQTKINCFLRATDTSIKSEHAEEIARINEILGVMKRWET
jgi:hypothetical protein